MDSYDKEIISQFRIAPIPPTVSTAKSTWISFVLWQCNVISTQFHLSQKQLTSFDMYTALREFGAIDRVSDDPETFTFTMVHTESVKALIPNRVLSVQSINFTVTFVCKQAIRRKVQPNSIYTLPDDCLREIFKFMDFKDLCHVQMVHRRFYNLAIEIIRKKLRTHEPRYVRKHSTDMIRTVINTNPPLWHLEKYLRNFGDPIKSIRINNDTHASKIMFGMMARNCRGVERLVCTIFGDTSEWHRSPASQTLFGSNSHIKRLTINGNGTNTSLPAWRLPHLRTLIFKNVHIRNDQTTQQFFRSNAHLHELKLHDRTQLPTDFSLLLRNLRQLRSCELEQESVPEIIAFLQLIAAAYVPIESFSLTGMKYSENNRNLFAAMGHSLRRLRSLQIDFVSLQSHVSHKSIVGPLRYLEHFRQLSITNLAAKKSRYYAKYNGTWKLVWIIQR